MQPKITRLSQDGITLGPLRTDEEAIGKYMEWMNDETITHWLGRNTIVTQWKDEEQWAEKEHPYTFSIYIQKPPTHIGTSTTETTGKKYNKKVYSFDKEGYLITSQYV